MESVGTSMCDEFANGLGTRRLVYVLSVWSRPEAFVLCLWHNCEEFAGSSRASRRYQRATFHHV